MALAETKIFVKNLPADIKEKEVLYIFGKYGNVSRAEIIMWPAAPSLTPHGGLAPVELTRERPEWQACAFIVYSTVEAAVTAIRALSGVYRPRSTSADPITVALARTVSLAPPLSEPVQAAVAAVSALVDKSGDKGFGNAANTVSNFLATATSATASHVAEKTKCKLFVGNLQTDLPKEAVTAVFAEFGRVMNVHVMSGKSKMGSACAFVELASPQEAELALKAMNGKLEPRIGVAPLTVTYFQSQSSGKAGQTMAAMAGARFGPY